MSQITDTSAASDVIRNQQVADSSSAAGSTFRINSLRAVRRGFERASKRWQGAYQGAYRRLLAFFGYAPASRLQPFTDDLDTAERTKELVRRLRG